MAELKKLRECPFCGGEAKHEIFDDGFFTWGRVECKQCGAMITTPPVNTIEAWNNRATEAEIRAMAIDEFVSAIEEYYFEVEDSKFRPYLKGINLVSEFNIRKIAEQLKEE